MNQLYAEAQTKAAAKPEPLDLSKTKSSRGIDDSFSEMLDSDPALRKFYELRRKALRTSVEQEEYLAMISDKQLIADARTDLLAATTSNSLDQEDELKRLQRIQFLNSALAWEDNPERKQAVEAASAVVMADIPASVANDVKGSMLGDKFDLFQLLVVSDPDQAKVLLAKARGTSSEKTLQFAWQNYWASKSDHVSSQ
jgi:hypothetical protein